MQNFANIYWLQKSKFVLVFKHNRNVKIAFYTCEGIQHQIHTSPIETLAELWCEIRL